MFFLFFVGAGGGGVSDPISVQALLNFCQRSFVLIQLMTVASFDRKKMKSVPEITELAGLLTFSRVWTVLALVRWKLLIA